MVNPNWLSVAKFTAKTKTLKDDYVHFQPSSGWRFEAGHVLAFNYPAGLLARRVVLENLQMGRPPLALDTASQGNN